MNPWLPHPGVSVDQAGPASCTAASVFSQSGSADAVVDLTEADVRESLGLIKPPSQEEITRSWLADTDQQVAAWRKMVLADEHTPMADRVEMVLRDEKTLRDSIVKEKIAKAMEAMGTPSMPLPSLAFAQISDGQLSEDGTFTCTVSVPYPADFIQLSLKVDNPVMLSAGDTLEFMPAISVTEE